MCLLVPIPRLIKCSFFGTAGLVVHEVVRLIRRSRSTLSGEMLEILWIKFLEVLQDLVEIIKFYTILKNCMIFIKILPYCNNLPLIVKEISLL